MKLLIIGDGGREHALAWLASKSPVVDKFFYFGKNAGILSEPKCEPALPLAPDISGVVRFAEQQTIDLTIVGPEQPLADGIVDQFQKAGLPIFGPTQAAAQLESSKWFAKDLMVRRNVPTAMARRFTTVHLEEALNYLAANGAPVVIKTDGLCGGKGSIVCHDIKQAIEAIQSCLVINYNQNMKLKLNDKTEVFPKRI